MNKQIELKSDIEGLRLSIENDILSATSYIEDKDLLSLIDMIQSFQKRVNKIDELTLQLKILENKKESKMNKIDWENLTFEEGQQIADGLSRTFNLTANAYGAPGYWDVKNLKIAGFYDDNFHTEKSKNARD